MAASAAAPNDPATKKTKVQDLRPGTSGHNLVVKVVSAKAVLQKSRADMPYQRHVRLSECIVGDDTASIVFTARNDQVDIMKDGETIQLHNAKVDMFRGSMRLTVDKLGKVEITEPASFAVKTDNNLSLIEFESIVVDE